MDNMQKIYFCESVLPSYLRFIDVPVAWVVKRKRSLPNRKMIRNYDQLSRKDRAKVAAFVSERVTKTELLQLKSFVFDRFRLKIKSQVCTVPVNPFVQIRGKVFIKSGILNDKYQRSGIKLIRFYEAPGYNLPFKIIAAADLSRALPDYSVGCSWDEAGKKREVVYG